MADSFASFTNARVRGMKSALLSRNELESMLDNGKIDQIGDTLLKSPYEVELAEALSRYQGADAVEDAVSRNLVNTFSRLLAMCREDSAAVAEIFISRWDLGAVKALLRNRHHGIGAEPGVSSLVPSASMPHAVQKELAAQDTMESLVRGLVAWSASLCRPLIEALPTYQETKNLRVLEDALDRGYFVSNLVRLGSYRSDDAKFLQELLRAEIDRINLRRLFEPRPAGTSAEDVVRELLPRGMLSDAVLREIASSPTPDRAAEVVSRTPYGDMADALANFALTGRFSTLERQFEMKFLDKLRRAAQRQGIGLASLLRYAWLKYNEVTNLRIIALGLAARLPKARLEQEIMYV